MCYLAISSTTSNVDLTRFDKANVVFKREMPGTPEECLLMHPNKWYAENAEEIAATLAMVAAFKAVLASGASLDCIDAWADSEATEAELAGDRAVNLALISESAFRLVENYRFELKYAVSP